MRRAWPLERILLIALLLLTFLIAVRPALDNDTYWHIRTGQVILDRGFPVGDPFNHTAETYTRIRTDWASQVLFAFVWRVAGKPGLSVLVAMLATLGMAFVWLTTRALPGVRFAASLLAAAAASYFWSCRPQMFTFVFTAVTGYLLWRWRRSPSDRSIWLAVPIFAVWANFHGAVIYGSLLFAATVGGCIANNWLARARTRGPRPLGARPIARLSIIGAAATAASVLNPSFLRIFPEPFDMTANSVRYVTEYQPPALADTGAWPFFALLALTAVTLVLDWRETDATDLFTAAGTGFFALRVTRAVSFFAEVAGPVAGRALTRLQLQRRGPNPATSRARGDGASQAQGGGLADPLDSATPARTVPAPAAIALVVAMVAVVIVATVRELDPDSVGMQERAGFPVGASEWMREHQPPARLFNTFDWGGYVLLNVPGYRISIDSRTDVYREYLDVYAGVIAAKPGWQHELDREGINTVLIDDGAPLAAALGREPGWQSTYRDDVATVFVRSSPVPPPADGLTDAGPAPPADHP